LPRIKGPVLGLYPRFGPIAGDEQIETMKAAIPDIRVVRIKSRYHMIQMLEPAACGMEVLHFVSQYDGLSCHE